MKKIKILLALCLSIVCFGAVSASAAMDTTMAEEKAIFEKLGFTLPEKAEETEFVTRGEFLRTLTQFFSREWVPSDAFSFTDVPADLSGQMAYAVAMGIVSDSDMFYPDEAVTYPQAIKMAVTFLGRGAEGELAGGYPSGYMAVATTHDMFAGMKDFNGDKLTARDFYQLMINVGQTRMLIADSNGNLVTGYTPFVEYFNMYQVKGILTYNERTSIKDDKLTVNKGCIAINSDVYRYDGDIPVGYGVEGWARNVEHNIPEVLMLREYNTETTELNLLDLKGSVDGKNFYYYEKGKQKKISIDNPPIIYNGVSAPTMSLNDIFKEEFGTVTFVNNDDDTAYDVIHVKSYYVRVAGAVSTTSKKIADENGEKAINLDNNGKVRGYSIVKDGVAVDLVDIIPGDLLMVYESKNGVYYDIEITTNSIEGTVKSFNREENVMTLGDTRYPFSEYFDKYYMAKIENGKEIEVTIAPDGVIHCLATAVNNANSYGYIINCYTDEESEEVIVKLACEDGVIRRVKIAKNFKYDGADMSKSSVEATLDNLGTKDATKKLVKYRLNDAKDTIYAIDIHTPLGDDEDNSAITVTDKSDRDNNLTEYSFPVDGNPGYKTGAGWIPYVSVTGSTKVFKLTISDDVEDDEIFVRASESEVSNYSRDGRADKNNDYKITDRKYRIYNVDEYGNAEAVVLISKSASQTAFSNTDPTGLVYRFSEVANTEGEEVYELVMYVNGQYNTYFTSDKLYEKVKAGTVSIAAGDYIAYKLGVDDAIEDMAVIYSGQKKEIPASAMQNYQPSDSSNVGYILTKENQIAWADAAVIPGWVYSYNGTSMALVANGHFNKLSDGSVRQTLPATKAEFEGLAKIFFSGVNGASYNIVSARDGKVAIEEVGLADLEAYVNQTNMKNTDFVLLILKNGGVQEVLIMR